MPDVVAGWVKKQSLVKLVHMDTRKVHIKSFGCQMNKLDTALVAGALGESGFESVESEIEADVVLINTCSVREHAEKKVFSHLGNLKHIKESRPKLIVGVIGCMAQRLGRELLEHEAVDIVCGPGQIPQIVRLVEETLKKREKKLAVAEKIRQKSDEEDIKYLEDFENVYDGNDGAKPVQTFVRAMRGCNNFCSYCVVPYVRGPEVSRAPADVVEQIKRMADRGVKLITLLGQTINSYKYTAGEKTYCLADLLAMAGEIDGIEWVRFVTSYPVEEFFDQICYAMRDIPKVCNYLHMPAQSGSDRILAAMNRHYTAGEYLELIERAKEIVPGIAVAGDFIVGFGNESEEDFHQTVELVKKCRYKNCFVFKYSPRPGTKSEQKIEDNVPEMSKKKRNVELLSVQEKISDELSSEFLGKKVKVFVEGLSKKPHLNREDNEDNPQLTGRTAEGWIVVFNAPVSLAGEFAKVRIVKTSPLTLFGEMYA